MIENKEREYMFLRHFEKEIYKKENISQERKDQIIAQEWLAYEELQDACENIEQSTFSNKRKHLDVINLSNL